MQDIVIILIFIIQCLSVAGWIIYTLNKRKRDRDLRRKINTIVEYQEMQINPELLQEWEDMEKHRR